MPSASRSISRSVLRKFGASLRRRLRPEKSIYLKCRSGNGTVTLPALYVLRPHPDVFLQLLRTRFAAVQVALAVDRDELRAGSRRLARVSPRILDERRYPPTPGIADPDAHLPARILHIVGFRVGDVNLIPRVEEDAARPPELRPLREELPFLVEELDPVVRAIAHEDAAARVHRNGVERAELA